MESSDEVGGFGCRFLGFALLRLANIMKRSLPSICSETLGKCTLHFREMIMVDTTALRYRLQSLQSLML